MSPDDQPPSTGPLRVVIVDDHPLFREGLRAVLRHAPGMEVVGEAATGDQAVSTVADRSPDVVVMDLQLPGLDGVEATRRILAAHPGIRVLVLTMLDDDATLVAALEAGAAGYLLKDSARAELVRAVEAVALGQSVFDPAVARRLVSFAAGHPSRRAEAAFPELSDREREVLGLVAQGHDNQSIARRLFLSSKTVRNHVSNIMTKLQVKHRSEAIVRAREAGLGLGTDDGR